MTLTINVCYMHETYDGPEWDHHVVQHVPTATYTNTNLADMLDIYGLRYKKMRLIQRGA